MIRINIPGFKTSDPGGPRWGDAQIIDDGKNYLVIDGYCEIGTTRLVNRLKKLNIKSPYLFISHPHWDHYKGIRTIINDKWFLVAGLFCQDLDSIGDVSGDVRSEKATLRTIIKEAKARGIPVKYLKNGDHLKFGEIEFDVFQQTEKYNGNSDAYLNDGSLCFWFPNLLYWTSGDGPDQIGTMCERHGCKPGMIKIPHHGNACPRTQAQKLWALGTRYCWDNDVSTKLTDFLQTGREDCLAVGMKYFSCIGDLNMVACNGRMYIYKGGQAISYKCPYNGKSTLKSANLTIVKKVLGGSLGTGEARTTNLLDAGFYPLGVQKQVNEIVKLVKG